MKRIIIGCVLSITLIVGLSSGLSGSKDKEIVYSKRRDLPLLESATPTAKVLAKANWNEAMSVLTREGRWIKVDAQDGSGWVYQGNVAVEKLPEENKNDLAIKNSSLNATAAGRGLTAAANDYADRNDHGEVAAQLKWAENLNAGVTKEDAKAYLKNHKLGEYGGAQ
jgi:hypothetical protein